MNAIESNEDYFEQLFNKLPLAHSELIGCEFEECEFRECDFSEALLKSCKFINCIFMRCNLSLIKLSYTSFYDVNFTESKLVGVDWTKASWPAFHFDSMLKFNKCILNDSSFFGLTMNGLQFEECKLHDVDFREGDFADSTMTYCDFTNSLFMRTNLQNVDFTESGNFNLNVTENRVTKAKFTRYEALNLLESLGIELVD